MRILIADDNPSHLRLLNAFLVMWNYEVVLARDGKEACNILLGQDAPKIAILDWMMPGMDGPEICREVRKQSERAYVYILLLTAVFEKSILILGLEAGADDYLTKPFEGNELKARLRTGRRILELQEQLVSVKETSQIQLGHDPLTGLQSRASILETLRVELMRSQREQAMVGIVMTDLDQFQQINDTHGRLAGDAVLREVAKRMRASVRPYDAVGRFGREQFLILMPGCDIPGAVSRAEELRNAIGKEPVDTPEGMITVTLSLGVTVSGGANPADSEGHLRAAEMALHEAKTKGGNQVGLSPNAMNY
ncbi:MAG: diguanylate cyclase [Terriglobia bacterium]|jgi:diguanylate cyclase (GGDEF)-like protein